MAVIDHLVYAVPDLEQGIADITGRLGVEAAYGGAHPGRGTHNALLALGNSYLEIIGPDPRQPDVPDGRPFGVTADMDPRLVTYAVRPSVGETIEQLADAMRDAGHEPGPVVAMSRATPDGPELHWHLTFPTLAAGGAIPFLIDWGATPNPSTTAPPAGELTALDAVVDSPDLASAVAAALTLDQFSVRSGPASGRQRTESGDDPVGAVLRATIQYHGEHVLQ